MIRRALNLFWNLWRTDYLNSLRERYLKERKENRCLLPREPIVGERVLLKEKCARIDWKLYTVKELLRGLDGKVRSVILENEDKSSSLIRPVTKICPLEVEL